MGWFYGFRSSKEALAFHFCPAITKHGKFFKQYYPRVDMPTFLLMVIKKILELIKLVLNQIGDLVAFK